MTDAWFLSNTSVTLEANHVKCKALIQGSCAHKSPNTFRNSSNSSKGSPVLGDYLPKSGNFGI